MRKVKIKSIVMKSTLNSVLSLLFLITTVLLTYLISHFEGVSPVFLSILGLNILFGIIIFKRLNGGSLLIIRLLLGALFIYSGFVKGVDPLGTQYRIEDYFYAYNMPWAVQFAIVLSVILNAAEFVLGALLILNVNIRITSIFVGLMMLFFTATTVYDALYSPVPDCGCFGDALVITNWQTFYKNLAINAFALVLLLRRGSFRNKLSPSYQNLFFGIIALGFVSFELYSIQNLPVIDFRPWKIGNRLLPEHPKPVTFYLTYKNNTTGETKEFLSSELPWQDSVFMANWSYDSTREDDPNAGQIKSFPMVDQDGQDQSKQLLSSESKLYMIVVYDLKKLDDEDFKLILAIKEKAEKGNNPVVFATSEVFEDAAKILKDKGLSGIQIVNSDDTSLKMAIRANPGLIVISKGVVLNKYNLNSTDIEEIKDFKC